MEEALIEVFRTIRRLRELSSVARHIKFPSLPAAYSESIAIAATPLLFGIDWRGDYGGRESDLIVQNSARDKRLRVEVAFNHPKRHCHAGQGMKSPTSTPASRQVPRELARQRFQPLSRRGARKTAAPAVAMPATASLR